MQSTMSVSPGNDGTPPANLQSPSCVDDGISGFGCEMTANSNDSSFNTTISQVRLSFVGDGSKLTESHSPYAPAPDLDELRFKAETARRQRNANQQQEKFENGMVKKLDGVGGVLSSLRGEQQDPESSAKDRIVLDTHGIPMRSRDSAATIRHSFGGGAVVLTNHFNQTTMADLPPLPYRPTDAKELRKLVRSKMIRCKVCGNRFGEKHILERHLRDKHHVEYLEYIYQQELEVAQMREDEAERSRIEELTSGGFIPPQSEVEAYSHDLKLDSIPLPGELTGGVVDRFSDSFGRLKQRRQYKKKVSPQCVFCDKRFRNDISLKKHIEKKHSDCVEFVQCLDCFKCVPDASHLKTHDCDMSFLCVECVPIRNMCTEERLVHHRMKFHRGANSGFKCLECNQKFLTPRKLRKHKKMSHVFVKTFQCHFCEEHFTSEVSVVTHERMHTGIIKFECKICDFKSNRYIEMEEHKKNEHGYLCSICQEKFAEWSDIKNHTLRDHGGYLSSESNTGYIESPRLWVMMKGE